MAIWMAIASAVMQAAQAGASQSSANANSEKDVTGGGLGKMGAALGAASDANAKSMDAGSNTQVGTNGGLNQKFDDIAGRYGQAQYFYGGETVSQIKKARPVKIVESSKPIQSRDGKCFYNNVHIPRKKV